MAAIMKVVYALLTKHEIVLLFVIEKQFANLVLCVLSRKSNGLEIAVFGTLTYYIKNECECFMRGSKHRETDESTRPKAECFYCLEVFRALMKHEARVFDMTSQMKALNSEH